MQEQRFSGVRAKIAKTEPYLLGAVFFSVPLVPKITTLFIVFWVLSRAFGLNKDSWEVLIGRKTILLCVFLYLWILVGLTYTMDLETGLFKIQTQLSFFIFPIFLGSKRIVPEMRNVLFHYFIGGLVLATIICFANGLYRYFMLGSAYVLDEFSREINIFTYQEFSRILDMHPTYFSLYLAIALFYLIRRFIWGKWKKMRKTICLILLFSMALFLAASKAVIYLFILILFGFSLLWWIKGDKVKPILVFGVIFATGSLSYLVSPMPFNRFAQSWSSIQDSSKGKKVVNESTSIRLDLWKLSFELAEASPLIGYGTGSVQKVLDKQCIKYRFFSECELLRKKNSHNQYLNFLLSNGLVFLVFFILLLISWLVRAIRNKDELLVFFLLMLSVNFVFESLLQRERGVVFFMLFATMLIVSSRNKDEGKKKQKNLMELDEIERKYDVQSISYDGDFVWPLLRLKYNEELRKAKNIESRTFKLKWSIVLKLLKTSIVGFKRLLILKKYNYWLFSSSDRRKRTLKGTYEDRVVGFASNLWQNSLIIENPYPLGKHYKKKEIYPDKIISQTLFSLATKFISVFLSDPKIKNEQLLKKIFDDLKVEINYKRVLKEFKAQYKLFRFLLKFRQPKVVIFVYSASSMGYIKAFKEKGIPVVEMQHGIINDSHFAYNIYKDFGTDFFPDFLFTYGKRERAVFHKENFFIDSSKVIPVGYYYLETFKSTNRNVPKAKRLRSRFKRIVVYSLQDPFDTFTFEFLNQVADLDSNIGYILVPRNPKKTYNQFKIKPNVIIEKELNIYECLCFADFHSTINSTCAIESLCFGTPNILYDFEGWARSYYSDILDDSGHTVFVNSADEFIAAIDRSEFYSKERIKRLSTFFFEDNFLENLERAIKTVFLSRKNGK